MVDEVLVVEGGIVVEDELEILVDVVVTGGVVRQIMVPHVVVGMILVAHAGVPFEVWHVVLEIVVDMQVPYGQYGVLEDELVLVDELVDVDVKG